MREAAVLVLLKYAIEMGSGALIHVPSFRNSKVLGGGDTHTDTQQDDFRGLHFIVLFQNNESRPKK
jgi:hypothetical protein